MTDSVRPTQAPFLRLDRHVGWRTRTSDSIFFNPRRGGLMLGRAGQYPISPFEPAGTLGGTTRPRGLAATPTGFLFLADPDHNRILGHDPARPTCCESNTAANEATVPFAPLWETPEPSSPEPSCRNGLDGFSQAPERRDPYHLSQPRDVCFSRAGELIIADTGQQRLLFLLWPSLRIRRIMNLPAQPWALAEDSRGRCWVLLRTEDSARVVRLDALGQIALCSAPDTLSPGATQIVLNRQDELFILDVEARRLQKLTVPSSDAGQAARPEPIDTPADTVFSQDFPPPLHLHQGTLWLPQDERPDCPALPLSELSVDSFGYLSGTSLPLLSRPRRIARPRSGVWMSAALDGEQDNWGWHRVSLEAELPANTRLLIQTFTDKAPLTDEQLDTLGERWSRPLLIEPGQAPEILVQSQPARYLWLRIEFRGDGLASPLVRAIDIQAPRQSSLRFLPPPFHQDPDSRHFLDRFLSYFDTVFAEVEYEIDHFARLLDTNNVPPGEFLDWLGSWFNLQFLAQWPADLRRTMISQAIPHFRQRGTLAGLRQMVQWHTGLNDPMPQIIEHYRLRERDPATVPVAHASLVPEGMPLAHRFTLVLPAFAASDQAEREQLERLIDAQKPAHSHYQLRLFEVGVCVARQATLGVDALLGHNPRLPLGANVLDDPRDDGLTAAIGSSAAVEVLGPKPSRHDTHSIDH
ncbi:phage tail protein [Marinobacter lacisalsi]|uniref:Phage tail protein n=1 Tax=Marinobacter lacisalsi TaxID=475979 RepID=A0ABV8QKV4_9GAMM